MIRDCSLAGVQVSVCVADVEPVTSILLISEDFNSTWPK